MAKRRRTRKRRTGRRVTKRTKGKLIGYTRTAGKYRLVYKKGKGRPTVGPKKYGSRKSMLLAARKSLTRAR